MGATFYRIFHKSLQNFGIGMIYNFSKEWLENELRPTDESIYLRGIQDRCLRIYYKIELD